MLLCIETSQQTCSIAIFDVGGMLSYAFSDAANIHGKLITMLIEEAATKAGIELKELKAICLSAGPGSYTGLRVGSSTAKGLGYGLKIPLIAIDTLQIMALAMQKQMPEMHYCPLVDARRMEVFTGLYDSSLCPTLPGHPAIVDEGFMLPALQFKQVVFGGNGLEKCKPFLQSNPNAILQENIKPTADLMGALAFDKFTTNHFADMAYFEPNYLKEFQGTKPKVA